jgi:hypothetical protein
MGRRKILEPINLRSRLADTCYQFGKDRCYHIFKETIESIFVMLIDHDKSVLLSDEQQMCLQVYLDEVRNRTPFTDILGEADNDLAPYKPDGIINHPYIPPSIASLMIGSKYMDYSNGMRSITDKNCGTGTFLLLTIREISEGRDPASCHKWEFTAFDQDELNAQMCAIQFMTNAALHNTGPGEISIFHKPTDQHKNQVLRMKYYESTKQYEIVRPGMSGAGSAQGMLFG